MRLREVLNRVYRDVQRVILPRLENSQRIYERFLRAHLTRSTRWLDLGCGYKIAREWCGREEREMVGACKMVVGVDCYMPSLKRHGPISLRVGGNIARLPFRDQSFDLATANMVVEHLDSPERQFQEIARILRPGGLFIIHTINALSYVAVIAKLLPERLKNWLSRLLGRKGDIFPTYYRVNTRRAVLRISRAAGFELLEVKMLTAPSNLAAIFPLALLQLFWLRILMTKSCEGVRTGMIVALRRPARGPSNA